MNKTKQRPKQTPVDPTQVKGWGVDADPKNDPTYPMKKRNDGEHKGYTWQRPPEQNVDVEVLHSKERPNVSAVFGRSTPPRGLSGLIRRLAFRYSESSYGHWLPLMLADRVGSSKDCSKMSGAVTFPISRASSAGEPNGGTIAEAW